MLAVLNHRATAYQELHAARTTLMNLRAKRSGLFIQTKRNPFSCHVILNLLADIAAAKLDALRILLSLDAFEKQLRMKAQQRKAIRIWLGSTKTLGIQQTPIQRKRIDGVTAFLLTTLWLRSLPKPRP
ncbi:MAG: hypothetical protein SFW65_02345 [Alphaproteobacteria bacterium]|nr:hypothetical protein [Alphaproteobacteria bacterium]